jgi:hypothetical protein
MLLSTVAANLKKIGGNLKNLILGAGVAILVAVLGIVIYVFFLQRGPSGLDKTQLIIPPKITPSPSPQIAREIEAGIFLLDSGWVSDISLDASGTKVRYFDHISGQAKTSAFDAARVESLSSVKFEDVLRVFWPRTKNQAIFEYTTADNSRAFTFYDFDRGSAKTFSSGVREIVWSPDSNKIAYHLVDDAKKINSIFISFPDGTKPSNISSLQTRSISLFWSSTSTIFALEKPVLGSPNTLFKIDAKTGAIKTLFGPVFGTQILPSPDGKLLLVATTDEDGTDLTSEIVDANTGNVVTNLPAPTLGTKCAWAKNSEVIYCAFPSGISFAKIPDMPFRYWRGEVQGQDDFGKYNVKTGEFKKIKEATKFDTENLLVSPQENYLIFLNRLDNSLYSIKL